MSEINWEIILKIGGMIILAVFATVAGGTLKNAKIGDFGGHDTGKERYAIKLITNIFGFLILELIIVAGIFKVFNEQVILLLFVACLGIFGVKFAFDLKKDK